MVKILHFVLQIDRFARRERLEWMERMGNGRSLQFGSFGSIFGFLQFVFLNEKFARHFVVLLVGFARQRSRLSQLHFENLRSVAAEIELVLEHLSRAFALVGSVGCFIEFVRRLRETLFGAFELIFERVKFSCELTNFSFGLAEGE